MTGKLRWGILGTAGIAEKAFIPAIAKSSKNTVYAVASRDMEKSAMFAEKYGIPSYYSSYQSLLDDRDIDAVYIPLPNHLHLEWSVKALEAGKHVLCEKPICLDAGQTEKLMAAAASSGTLAAEAFMVIHHPQWKKLREIADEGVLGEHLVMESCFSYYNDNPGNIRNIREYGGGALYDIGCYPVLCSRYIFGEEPSSVFSSMLIDPGTKTDIITTGIMDFPSGARSVFTVSTRQTRRQCVVLAGTEGVARLPVPFNPPADRSALLQLTGKPGSAEKLDISFELCDQYALQADSFADAVFGKGIYPMSLEDSLGNIRVLEALFRSAGSGKREKP